MQNTICMDSRRAFLGKLAMAPLVPVAVLAGTQVAFHRPHWAGGGPILADPTPLPTPDRATSRHAAGGTAQASGPSTTHHQRTPKQVLMNDFAIAGFRYYNGPGHLAALAVGTKLTLRSEPTNPHDPFAVEVMHDRAKLGYVPRTCNQHISRLLLHRVPLACEVLTLNPKSPPWEAVTAVLFLIQPT